jgi:poly-beta-1,6-N-acetyl-D-glucosamine N-deacetylase
MVWPYGRYNGAAVDVVKELGFQFALTLDPEPASIRRPFAIGRILPTNDPDLATMVSSMRFEDPLPRARRLVALNPADVWAGDDASMNERLGRVIERLRTLGATGIVLDAVVMRPDGRLVAAWFPNGQLPVRADVLSRIAWQCQSRAGVLAYVRLPASAALRTFGDRGKVSALFHDLGAYVPIGALFVDDAPCLASVAASRRQAATPWDTRAARDSVARDSLPAAEALTLTAFHAIEFSRPGLQLALVVDPDSASRPAAIADLTLLPVVPRARDVKRLSERLQAGGWLAPQVTRLSGLWFFGDRPPKERDLATAIRIFQSRGGTAVGWAADDPIRDKPEAKIVAPTVSAANFPVKF